MDHDVQTHYQVLFPINLGLSTETDEIAKFQDWQNKTIVKMSAPFEL